MRPIGLGQGASGSAATLHVGIILSLIGCGILYGISSQGRNSVKKTDEITPQMLSATPSPVCFWKGVEMASKSRT